MLVVAALPMELYFEISFDASSCCQSDRMCFMWEVFWYEIADDAVGMRCHDGQTTSENEMINIISYHLQERL
ncbi:hypothetical protein L2E82_02016 [Cichorium intybus]|uniref:Uncharacterized protein n=1 Tax=Cichorium intybus TaxID=13427 RepID=A0ACB9H0H4_CICIN|nr:hypothetical protein L2E82_02016 [Cichorium intybus]